MTLALAVLLVGLSAVACLTQSMPVLKVRPPPNWLSYGTFRYRPAFAGACALLAVWIAARWIGGAGWLAPASLAVSALLWAGLVVTPSVLFRPYRGEPRIVTAREASMVSDDGTVIGVVVGREARAYPETMLMPQHVVTDEVGGQRMMISWCPLCHSGMVFEGRLHGRPIEPRVVGGGNNNVLVYDATSRNMFQQITGEILEGPDKGSPLAVVPSMITTWSEWRSAHPDSTVWTRHPGSLFEWLSRTLTLWAPTTILDTEKPFYVMDKPADRRLGYVKIVSGVEIDGRRKAYSDDALTAAPIVNDEVAGIPLAVFSKPGGAIVRLFDRRVGEGTLRFRPAGEDDRARGIIARDLETGSGWSLDGEALEGSQTGAVLPPVRGISRCFWFAFAHFYPGAEVWDADPRTGSDESRDRQQ